MPASTVVQLTSGEYVQVGVTAMRHSKGDGAEVHVHQLPFVLAWAMTVHRLQGVGLDCLITAISRQMVFEPNQAYVAVSRATGRAALYLLSFDRSMVVTYPVVAEYYQRLRAFRFAFRIVLDSTTAEVHMAAAQEMTVAICAAPAPAPAEVAICAAPAPAPAESAIDLVSDDDVVEMATWPVTPMKRAVPRHRQKTPVKRKLLAKPMERGGKVWIVEDEDLQIEIEAIDAMY